MTKKEIEQKIRPEYLEAFRKDERFSFLITYLVSSIRRNEWETPEALAAEWSRTVPELDITASHIRHYARTFPAWIDYRRIGETGPTVDPSQPIEFIRAWGGLLTDFLGIAREVLKPAHK